MTMRRKILLNTILAGSAVTFMAVAGLVAAVKSNKNIKNADAYTAASITDITNINLNDCSETEIRNYYSALNSKTDSEKQGTNLLMNLKEILKTGQTYFKYDGSSLYAMYEITDRDWVKSPASAISGYNSTTNTISNYSYGSSASNPGMNPFIHALYVNREGENHMRAWARESDGAVSHGDNKEWGFDQEHIWPKSQGFETKGKGGARGDPMHLWPGDSDVNSSLHGNQYYGYVNITSSTKHGKWSYGTDNYIGTSLTLGSGDNVFEPQDCDKGDIARAIFYMVARYNYLSGSDSDGIDSNNPNLELIQSNDSLSGYDSSTTLTGKMGILTDLLAWHHADPVDSFEIHRNNLLFRNYTHNRNPFIDFPEWVDYIWGTAEYSGRTYKSYDSTPTGAADPTLDTINDYNPTGPVAVTGISLSPTSTTISISGTTQLTPTISPSRATNKNISWSSNKTNVATVSSSGLVTGVADGTATITATTEDGGFTATCTVTVDSGFVAVTGISLSPASATLDVGSTQVLTPSFTPSNASNKNIIWSSNKTRVATVDSNGLVTANAAGVAIITATTEDGGFTATCSIKVNATEEDVENPVNVDSSSGTTYSATVNGLAALKVGKSSGTPKDGVVSITVGAGAKRLSFYAVGWSGKSVTISITTQAEGVTLSPSSIALSACSSVSGSSTTFTIDIDDETMLHHIVLDGVEDDTTFFITTTSSETRFVIWGATWSTSGDVDHILNSITIETSNVKKIFVQNETFTDFGLVVTAHYSDGEEEEVLPTNVSEPDLTTVGEKTVTVTYNGKTAVYTIHVVAEAATSISATACRSYTVGDTIYRSDITVVDNNGIEIEDFYFEDDSYQFVYSDAASGGSATNKSFLITYGELSTNLVVSVSRVAYSTSISETLNNASIGNTQTTYANFSNVIGASGTVFDGNTAGGKSAIQMRPGSDCGIISKVSPGYLASVSVTWNADTGDGRILNIYGNNEPYKKVSDLYDSSKQGILLGTIVNGTSTSLTIEGDYQFIGITNGSSGTGALYLDSLTITYEAKSAINLSNYIMYEDTNNQCKSKLSTATAYFNGLTSSQREIFMTSDDYVVMTARERLEAWARHEGKTIEYVDGDYVVTNTNNFTAPLTKTDSQITMFLIVTISVLGIISVGVFLHVRKKKEQ